MESDGKKSEMKIEVLSKYKLLNHQKYWNLVAQDAEKVIVKLRETVMVSEKRKKSLLQIVQSLPYINLLQNDIAEWIFITNNSSLFFTT